MWASDFRLDLASRTLTNSLAGLHYYRDRYYDSSNSRFISEDPIGFDGGENFYAYTRNSPVDVKDPFGLYILAPGVPPPSAALDKLLKCLDGKVGPVTVTATTNGKHTDKGHELGTSVDILPPASDKIWRSDRFIHAIRSTLRSFKLGNIEVLENALGESRFNSNTNQVCITGYRISCGGSPFFFIFSVSFF